MSSLRPSLIAEHHSESSLNDLAREASPCSEYLRPARDEDTTYTGSGKRDRKREAGQSGKRDRSDIAKLGDSPACPYFQ